MYFRGVPNEIWNEERVEIYFYALDVNIKWPINTTELAKVIESFKGPSFVFRHGKCSKEWQVLVFCKATEDCVEDVSKQLDLNDDSIITKEEFVNACITMQRSYVDYYRDIDTNQSLLSE